MRERAPQKHIGLYSHMVWHYKRQYRTKKSNIEKIYAYASERGASEPRRIFAFLHSKTAISFNILLVLLILYLRNIYIFRSQITSSYTINAVPCYCLWYGVIYKRQFTDKTLTLKQSMYMRASGASELRKFSHFYILKLLFLSIVCWYFRYFVGTNDMLSAYMYRQISKCTDKTPKKHYGGGGGGNCPPAPPLAALMIQTNCR